MRLVGCARGVLVLIGLLAGCDISEQQKARDVCTAVCNCAVSPSQVEECIVEDCLPDLPPVSDPCLQCVYENSQMCSDLFDDCTDFCIDPGTP